MEVSGWKKNGTDSMPIYEFSPSKRWAAEKIEICREVTRKKIEDSIFDSVAPTNENWIIIFDELPICLKKIVLFEISNGNNILSVGKTGWPNGQSVVVSLGNRFHAASRIFCKAAIWRLLDDPHYCREEISESMRKTEYLIIV